MAVAPGTPYLCACFILYVFQSKVSSSRLSCQSSLRRAHYFERLSSAKTTVFALLVNIFLLLNLYFVIFVVTWPDDDFEQMISECVRFSGMRTTRIVFLGFSMKYRVSGFRLGLLLELLLSLTLMGIINIFCALKINGFLKDASQNSNSLIIQRRMFILLLLQTTIPFTFLLVPCFVAFFLLFTGIDSTPLITNVLSILLIIYPVFNPVIIIGYLDEYRNFVLSNLKLKKRVKQPETSHIIFNITRPATYSSQAAAF
ncbi:7TM GPCR domain containing protein [Trichostrongylus colubriformis]|uniref:7TM GPCR domain containing protein n=1 Tax=Trichostrongylus colubriformis TaxID=6319 RepID=A0AAN8IFV2_TRICO